MKRAAIYIRVSTIAQAQEGDSVPAQRDALRKYIDDRPELVFAGEYMDDGMSGTRSDRDELCRMLNDVQAGKIDLILVTKLDRLYRSIRHYLNMMDILDKAGVGWLAIWEPIYDTTTPAGRLIVNQMMSIAQFEAENTGQRIRQVNRYKAEKGEVLNAKPPFGYRIENKHLVPSEDAEKARRIFEYYALTGNLCDTVRFAASIGFKRHISTINSMLKNRKYIGEFRGKPDYCPALISVDMFEDVQRKLSINVKSSQKYPYIFSGLIVCEECGGKLGGRVVTSQRGRYRVYRCEKFCRPTHDCINKKSFFETTMERYLLEHVPELARIRITEIETERRKDDSKERRQKIERKIERLKELYVDGMIEMDEYRADRAELEGELSRIREPVSTDTDALREFLNLDLAAIYGTMTNEEKRYFWRQIIRQIRVDGQKNISIDFF